MRVVLDANVFVSASFGKGASGRLVRWWLSGSEPFEVVICGRLIGEVADVLARPRLRRYISEVDARAFVDAIGTVGDVVADPAVESALTRDGDDDYLIVLARDHQAAYIVTGDDDLLQWPEQRPPAMTPAAFEQLLASVDVGVPDAQGLPE